MRSIQPYKRVRAVRPPLLLITVLCMLVPLRTAAQPFQVIEADPPAGSVEVELSTTVRFQFNKALDINTDWNSVFLFEPREALQYDRVSLLLDDQDRPAVVEFAAEHQPETDYTWIIYAAQTRSGEKMGQPYVLRYTTASDIGDLTLTGSVQTAPSSSIRRSASSPLAQLVKELEERGLGRPLYRQTPSRAVPAGASKDQEQKLMEAPDTRARKTGGRLDAQDVEPHTLVLLLDEYVLDESDWTVQNAAVFKGSTGSYSIDRVRNETYWPIVVRYTDATHTTIEALGYYDADDDGEPDPVSVDENTGSVDLDVYEFSLTTAGEHLSAARTAAADIAGDQELKTIRGNFGARPAGTAYVWTYRFYSPSQNTLTTVTVDPLELTVETEEAPSYLASMRSLPEQFVNSDEAVSAALEDGGNDFLEPYRPGDVITTIEAGNLYWNDPPDQEAVFWHVKFTAFTNSSFDTFTRFVNLSNGTIITSTEAETELPETTRLEQNYPNPFNPSTTISFELPRATSVTLTVYDVTGRRIATVLNRQDMQPGRHHIRWSAAGRASGVYMYRLETGEQTRTRTMILAK